MPREPSQGVAPTPPGADAPARFSLTVCGATRRFELADVSAQFHRWFEPAHSRQNALRRSAFALHAYHSRISGP